MHSAPAAPSSARPRARPASNEGLPRLAGVSVALPAHRYRQQEIVDAFAELCLRDDPAGRRAVARVAAHAGVRTRNLSLPLEEYPRLDGFTGANQAWLETALSVGAEALTDALDAAGVAPEEIDVLVSTTVTGLAVPSLDARLAHRLGLRQDVKRLPLFGLGCVAGAAGVARLYDYLRSRPDEVAVLLSVELCSLTHQRDDASMANLVATSLFGDGAAAVVAVGADRAEYPAAPAVVATRSRLYPDSEHLMGWDIGTDGFRVVLSPDVPTIAEHHLAGDVSAFLAAHGLTGDDVSAWVCHPGGPKVIEAVEAALKLGPEALAHTRASLAARGNLSSASVLDVLCRTLAEPPPPGSPGLMIAMGPGFCSELVLLRW